MTKVELMTNVTRSFHRFNFKLKKHSPEILIAAGVVGVVTSAVMACKATMKVQAVLDNTAEQIEAVHESTERGYTYAPDSTDKIPYEDQDAKKDLAIIYTKTGLEFAKMYAPSVVLGALSLGSIVTSHHILRTRNVALAAAYTAVDTGFKEYRGRVVERFGEALDKELKYNIKAQEVEEVTVDKKGKEKTVKKTVEVIDPNEHSVYAFFFDDGCTGWTKDAELNLMFARRQQDYANNRLKLEGHLFLNDVREMFGLPRTKAGQVVGWIYDEKNPNGDNYVDFGIYDANKPRNRDFVNGYERTILLDPNVDGNILNLI